MGGWERRHSRDERRRGGNEDITGSDREKGGKMRAHLGRESTNTEGAGPATSQGRFDNAVEKIKRGGSGRWQDGGRTKPKDRYPDPSKWSSKVSGGVPCEKTAVRHHDTKGK